MANIEHKISALKGQPTTILKYRKNNANELMFLKPCPQFPNIKDLSFYENEIMEVEILGDCNGFCGIDDLTPPKNQEQLNLAF